MLSIIKRHNRLNGIIFSVVEFAAIALFVGALAAYFARHHQLAYAIAAIGITLNCLPVVIVGIQMLLDRDDPRNRLPSFWNKAAREQHLADNPHMLRDTLLLTGATLIPLLLLIVVLFEASRYRPITPGPEA